MVLLSNPDQRRAVEPSAWRNQADTPLDLNPRFGLQKPTLVLRVFEIMVGVVFSHLLTGVMPRASGVEGGSPWALKWSTYWRRAVLGHNRGSPDVLCPFFSPLMLFFWVLNISVKMF